MATVAESPLDERHRLESLFAAELQELRDAAHRQGYEEGQKQAAQVAAAAMERQQQDAAAALAKQQSAAEARALEVDALLENLDKAYQQALRDLEPAAVAIAYAGLTRVLGHAESYRSLLASMVSQAVDEFGRHDGLRIFMSPCDLELLQDGSAPWRDRLAADKRLPPASCLMEAGPRSLDASLMLQLEGLRRRLVDVCESRGDGET